MSAILTNDEQLLPLVEAVRRVGEKPSLQTVRRWCHRGIRGGKRLEFVRVGHELRTSVEAVKRFFAALSETQIAIDIESVAKRSEIKKRLERHYS